MKKIFLLLAAAMLLFSGCTQSAAQAQEPIAAQQNQIETNSYSLASDEIDTSGGVPSAADTPGFGKAFDIKFHYKNHIYKYDLEALWTDVSIKKEGMNLLAALGTEVLLDGTTEMFTELDADNSETINREEFAVYEEDFPFGFDGINENKDDDIDIDEFGHFTAQLNGVELFPGTHSITQPSHKDYDIRLDSDSAPVSLKILRAGEGGFKAMEGVVFPEGTVFIELQSEFEVYLKQAPDFELPPGFLTPLLSMYLEQDYEKNNHGALGFSSIVDTNEFNGIFEGKTFSLEYKGKGESGVLDEYYLTITPQN